MSSLVARPRAVDLIEIVTVGLPFCAFKIIAGAYLVASSDWRIAGLALIALGVVDAGFNAASAITLLFVGRPRVPVCTAQALMQLARRTDRARDVGTAVDTLLSFSLVAAMLGTGALPLLASGQLAAWNAAVIMNVLGAGALRLIHALGPEPK